MATDNTTIADLRPGARFFVSDGTTITPFKTGVEVRWVGKDSVYYHKHGTPSWEVRESSINRFLEIITSACAPPVTGRDRRGGEGTFSGEPTEDIGNCFDEEMWLMTVPRARL